MIVGFYNGFNKHKSGSKSELWFDFLMENHKAFASLLSIIKNHGKTLCMEVKKRTCNKNNTHSRLFRRACGSHLPDVHPSKDFSASEPLPDVAFMSATVRL
jgi:hypothetical protein